MGRAERNTWEPGSSLRVSSLRVAPFRECLYDTSAGLRALTCSKMLAGRRPSCCTVLWPSWSRSTYTCTRTASVPPPKVLLLFDPPPQPWSNTYNSGSQQPCTQLTGAPRLQYVQGQKRHRSTIPRRYVRLPTNQTFHISATTTSARALQKSQLGAVI